MSSPLPLRTGVSLLLAFSVLSAQAQKKTPAAAPSPAAAPAESVKEPLADESSKVDAPALPSASPTPAAAAPATPAANIRGLEKLTPDQNQQVAKDLGDVANFMGGVRLQEALEKLNDAEKLTGDFHLVSNLRGAVFTKMRDFKSARAEFEKAIVLTKNLPKEAFHPRFNLAEINFVEKKWDDARKQFTELLNDPNLPDAATGRLIKYKLLICDLQQKKAAAAATALEQFDQYDNDSPAFYFAQAATAFAADKKDDAEEWLSSAAKIYPKELNDVYQDSLVEVGWLQTLQ
jgi:tetratricopeptide (TPR) repeat protein